MKVAEFFVAELDREVARSRRALEAIPEGRYDWKPHETSMLFGYLADMVATIPTWIAMQVTKDDLDIAPVASTIKKDKARHETRADLLAALDTSATEARSALESASDEFLQTSWDLKAHGKVVLSGPRVEMIQDSFNHWAHHRGQLMVYLRLMGASVPAIYGPSKDDPNFR